MNYSGKALTALIVFLALAAGIYVGNKLLPGDNTGGIHQKRTYLNKLTDVVRLIDSEYVDNVVIDSLDEILIHHLLQTLDPHSEYISSDEFNVVNDPLMGSFDGIGIQFNLRHDTVLVVQPISGGPSERAGIRAGDRIVEVEGQGIAGTGISNQEVMKLLKGPRRTQVNIGVFRRGHPSIIHFNIVRDKIPTHSLDVAYMIDSKTGYIRISRFSAITSSEFISAAKELKESGMTQLILDLRGNGGGMLQSAVELADQLLPSGSSLVYTEGRKRTRELYKSGRRGILENKKLIVLIDEFSASASEIIAGAVQDNDRGLIIGRRSFGKGLVQEQIKLKDGSAIRLTVARYYTPSGRSIQSPYDDGAEKYYENFVSRLINHAADSIHSDTIAFYTKGGRIVYGGGGIQPDIDIPYDTAETSQWYLRLINHGLLYNYALDYTDANRHKLDAYKTAANFVRDFRLSTKDFNDFLEWCLNNNIYPDANSLSKSRAIVINRLESYIGRNAYGEEAFYPIYLKNDQVLKRAVDEINRP